MSKYQLEDDTYEDEEDAQYQAAMEKNLQEYPAWKEKIKRWTWKMVADKLRTLEVKISRHDFENFADELPSAFAVASKFLDRVPTNKGGKILQNLGFVWAAMEFLWDEWIGIDRVSLERFFLFHQTTDSEWKESVLTTDAAYTSCIESWQSFFDDHCQTARSYEEVVSWLIVEDDWLEKSIQYTLELLMDGAKEQEKANLGMVALFHEIGKQLQGIETKNAYYALAQIWLHLVNGNEEALENAVEQYRSHFPDSVSSVYEMVSDFYENPPAYAYTPANTQRSYEYKIKLLSSIDPDA